MAAAGPSEVVYGRNPVRELLAAGRRRVHEVYALPDLVGEGWLRGVGALPATRAALGRLCGSSDHQGVVAVCDPYPYVSERDLVRGGGALVCLDGAQDPRNLGAVARVVDAAGAAGLVIPERGSPGVTPTVCKASAGATEHVPIARVSNLASFLHDAKQAHRWVVGAATKGAADYRDIEWPEAPVLVLGAEGSGLRTRVRGLCDLLVTIPMRGRVESLNLSVAAAVLLFEALRRVQPR